jgi:hypothetical protein
MRRIQLYQEVARQNNHVHPAVITEILRIENQHIGDSGTSGDKTQHHERLGEFVKRRVKGRRDKYDHEGNDNPEADKEKSLKMISHQQMIQYCEKSIQRNEHGKRQPDLMHP